MRRHPTVPDDRVGASEGYDWSRFGRHRLRTAAAVLLDHPISPSGWAATVWADSVDPSGWRGFRWEPGAAGGWELPSRFVLGDVVELGSGSARWVGVVDGYEPGGWLTSEGRTTTGPLPPPTPNASSPPSGSSPSPRSTPASTSDAVAGIDGSAATGK